MTTQPSTLRSIRSFVSREGRLTKAQQRALDTLWDRYGLDLQSTPIVFDQIFEPGFPVTLEIGFGNGASLLEMAEKNPERGFIGIEVHRPGVGQLLHNIERLQLKNIRVICADAVVVLEQMIPQLSLDRVQLFFPDPWPKKRHHKRRIVNTDFSSLVASRLKPAGIFHLATDWAPYAEVMLEVLNQSPDFSNQYTQFSPRPGDRPLTKFEQRGQRKGHEIFDLIFNRHSVTAITSVE